MTVLYGEGVLKVSQRYLADWPDGPFLNAKINLYAELRPIVGGDPRFQFEYRLYHINARPNLPVIDPVTAALWRAAQKRFESEFTERFREKFRKALGEGFVRRIMDRGGDLGEILLSLLRDAYIKPNEFGLGFCLPVNSWEEVAPRQDDIPGNRALDLVIRHIGHLPPEARRQVSDFATFLSQRRRQ